MTELQLIDDCKLGDNSARKKLYETYSQQMLGICIRYTGSRIISQDLLHDGFIKVFMSIQSFQYRGSGSLSAWISKIFTNTCLEYLRKAEPTRNVVSLEECWEPEFVPDEKDCEIIPNKVLMDFISELPTGYRTIFNMYTFEEYSHKEIASFLRINESSSRSQLSRAKNILTNKIQKYLNENG